MCTQERAKNRRNGSDVSVSRRTQQCDLLTRGQLRIPLRPALGLLQHNFRWLQGKHRNRHTGACAAIRGVQVINGAVAVLRCHVVGIGRMHRARYSSMCIFSMGKVRSIVVASKSMRG